jgi:predicted DNA-binding transcriptional regulator YafY
LALDIESKLRPLYLIRILKEYSDEDHPLTTVQLINKLRELYGVESFRTTIKSDVEILQKAGFGVQIVRSTQNLYSFIDRDFDIPEIKLLIDAVQASKFITKSKSDQLVSKLTAFAGSFKSQELKRNLVVDGRIKAENEQAYLIVDAINEAINVKKKICFQTTEYNVKKSRILHNRGEIYIFSPYSLVWDGDFYYVVGFSDKYQSIGSHRVDRILKRPEILDEPAVSPPSSFDINRYINTMFRMYDAPRQKVELQVENHLMDAIIDKFGTDVTTYACDQHSFRVVAEVAVGTVFFNWIFGFQGQVKIKAPESVREQYKKLVLKAAEDL